MTLVLIVDDHPLFRDGFAAMLGALRPDWRVHMAGSVAEAMTSIALETPDLIVLDAMLPDGSGFGLAETLTRADGRTPCIMISSRDDPVAVTRAFASGARGIIGKAAGADQMIAGLEAGLAGRTIDGAVRAGGVPALTPRQASVLNLLAEGQSNKQICYHLGIAERTVRAHLTELFQLLGAHSRTQAILRAKDLGLLER